MGGCSAVDCFNRSSKSKRVFRYPANISRRTMWIRNTRRTDWIPNDCLCEDHFDASQFEQARRDGRKLLRPDAVPTLFKYNNFRCQQLEPRPIVENRPTYQRIGSDHAYCQQKEKEVDITENSNNVPENRPIDECIGIGNDHAYSQQQEEDVDITENDHAIFATPHEASEATKEATGRTERSVTTTPCETSEVATVLTCVENPSLAQKIKDYRIKQKIARLKENNDHLRQINKKMQQKIYDLQRQARNSAKQVERLVNGYGELTREQSRILLHGKRISKWSQETLKQAVEIRFACGAKGYEFLRKKRMWAFPLPSYSTLCSTVRNVQFLPGALNNVMEERMKKAKYGGILRQNKMLKLKIKDLRKENARLSKYDLKFLSDTRRRLVEAMFRNKRKSRVVSYNSELLNDTMKLKQISRAAYMLVRKQLQIPIPSEHNLQKYVAEMNKMAKTNKNDDGGQVPQEDIDVSNDVLEELEPNVGVDQQLPLQVVNDKDNLLAAAKDVETVAVVAANSAVVNETDDAIYHLVTSDAGGNEQILFEVVNQTDSVDAASEAETLEVVSSNCGGGEQVQLEIVYETDSVLTPGEVQTIECLSSMQMAMDKYD